MRILIHCAVLLGLCYFMLVAIDQLMHTHPLIVITIIFVCAGYSVYISERHVVPLERNGPDRARSDSTTIAAE